jgi:hypothetical protein
MLATKFAPAAESAASLLSRILNELGISIS